MFSFWDMFISIDSFVGPDSCSVTTSDGSVVLPYGSLAVMLFGTIMGEIVGVASFYRWMFAPESLIACGYSLGELVGVLILLIKIILRVLILILFLITPKHHSQPFPLTPSLFL